MSLRDVSDIRNYEQELLKDYIDIYHNMPSDHTQIRVVQDILNEYYEFNKLENISYYNNWSECMHNIEDIYYKKKDNILRWLNLFNKKIVEIDLKKYEKEVEEAADIKTRINQSKASEEYIKNIQMDEYEAERVHNLRNKKLSKISHESIYDVCKFVDYRDQVIKILREDFKCVEFKTSTELLNYKFDNIQVVKKN